VWQRYRSYLLTWANYKPTKCTELQPAAKKIYRKLDNWMVKGAKPPTPNKNQQQTGWQTNSIDLTADAHCQVSCTIKSGIYMETPRLQEQSVPSSFSDPAKVLPDLRVSCPSGWVLPTLCSVINYLIKVQALSQLKLNLCQTLSDSDKRRDLCYSQVCI